MQSLVEWVELFINRRFITRIDIIFFVFISSSGVIHSLMSIESTGAVIQGVNQIPCTHVNIMRSQSGNGIAVNQVDKQIRGSYTNCARSQADSAISHWCSSRTRSERRIQRARNHPCGNQCIRCSIIHSLMSIRKIGLNGSVIRCANLNDNRCCKWCNDTRIISNYTHSVRSQAWSGNQGGDKRIHCNRTHSARSNHIARRGHRCGNHCANSSDNRCSSVRSHKQIIGNCTLNARSQTRSGQWYINWHGDELIDGTTDEGSSLVLFNYNIVGTSKILCHILISTLIMIAIVMFLVHIKCILDSTLFGSVTGRTGTIAGHTIVLA